MQLLRRNTLTFFAVALALVCFLEMAPSARADFPIGELTKKTEDICNAFFFFPPCKTIVAQVLSILNSISANPVKDTSSSSTTTTTTVAPKA